MTVTKPEPATESRLPRELLESTSFLLKRLGFAAKARALEANEELGFNPYQYSILLTLDDGAPPTQGAIAELLGWDKGQLVGYLDELEEQGLIERRRDPGDRRRHVVKITPAGRKALGRMRTLSRRLDDELLAPLDDAERRRLHALLLKLGAHHLPHCSP